MGFFSKDIKTLDDLFVHTLRDIYYAEKQIEKALPKMVDKATSPELKAGFEKHLQETKAMSNASSKFSRCTASRQGGQLPGHRRHSGGSRRDRRH